MLKEQGGKPSKGEEMVATLVRGGQRAIEIKANRRLAKRGPV